MAEEETTTTTETDDGLGDAGKKALDAERKARKAAETAAKAAEKERDDIKTRLASLEADAMSVSEKAIDAAKKESADAARSEERTKWQKVVLDARVEAKASQKLADPDYARLLNLDGIEVDENGSIKGDLDGAIDALLKEKPALAARAGTRQEIDQGAQGGAAGESIDAAFGKAITDAVK